MRRLVLLRRGETLGDSGRQLQGSTDLELSPAGRQQLRQVAARLRSETFDGVASSPLKRAWQSAWIVAAGQPVRLVADFREIHLGRWEGRTREEIQASDPILFEDWARGAPGFEYPGGEPHAEFFARIERGLAGLLQSPGHAALVVAHQRVIRRLVEVLTGETLREGMPELAGSVDLTAEPDGRWILGRRSSNPPALDENAA